MKLKTILTAGALATSLLSQAIMAEEAATAPTAAAMPAMEKKDLEKFIHDYLVNNPEVLIEASQMLQQKQQKQQQDQAKAAITDNAKDIFDAKLTSVGNPKGSVTVAEFFDYQCIHCKKMVPTMASLIKKDSDLRVIYKEFPIFGKTSEMASRAALAAGMQGKYVAMHEALMKVDKRLDEKTIMDTAKSVGLDLKKLKKDMDSAEVTAVLENNRQLAEKLHLMGTPAFIVGATPNGQFKQGSEPTFLPGEVSEQTLQETIKKAAGN